MDAPFTMIRFPAGGVGYLKNEIGYARSEGANVYHGTTMVQHDLSGQRLFMHRNLQKWPSLFKPVITSNLTPVMRAWNIVKECVGGQHDCASLLTYDGGNGLSWKASGKNGAQTVILPIEKALGWDAEEAVMQAFRGLWDMPEYASYMEKTA